MLDILAITSPIFIIILIGFLMTRFGVFAKADMRVFGKFVVNLALPALLFNALAQRQVADILNPSYLLAYAIGSLAVIGVGFLWARRVARVNEQASTFYAMGMSCSNSGYIGYPILLLTLPSVAGVALALNMMVENLLALPLLLTLAERGRGSGGAWATIRMLMLRLARNPLMIGLLAGLTVSLLRLKLPDAITRTVTMFSAASGAVALFVIGGTLVGLSIGSIGKEVAPIVIGKLLLHPLAVFVAITLMPSLGLPSINPELQMAAVLMAAVPMLGIYATLAQQYGQEDFSAVALLLTTVASFFTLSGVLWALQRFAVFA
ncbi:AEC family transporter [Propionivibrio limicola]|uniref:AEC family transporter n=1 Tax=Propionivibrio limicola TaxID=167645 RepID=UPI0012925A27|nr:AEC family transporter [Propionivibrio limicola]